MLLHVLAFVPHHVPPPRVPKVKVSYYSPPSCKTCLFYKKETEECLAFATQEPVSGQIINRSVVEARSALHMCGPYGEFWISKNVREMYPSLKEDTNKNNALSS